MLRYITRAALLLGAPAVAGLMLFGWQFYAGIGFALCWLNPVGAFLLERWRTGPLREVEGG